MDELIEAMAKAMVTLARQRRVDGLPYPSRLEEARAAYAAIEATGYAVVPKEPTPAMFEAGGIHPWGRYADSWRAMLAAAPKVTP
jgi:hypothetical protein